jgi:cytochrome P450
LQFLADSGQPEAHHQRQGILLPEQVARRLHVSDDRYYTKNRLDIDVNTGGPNDLFKQLFQQFSILLLSKKGLRWRSRRRLLTPAFHFQILESFFDVFNDQSHQLIKELDAAAAARPAASVDGSVNVYKILTQCALDIICGWPTFLLFF